MKAPSINPARVDFVTLRLFCAVARAGSITRGAAECHIALSAASRRLAEFEKSAGSMLLERSQKGVALTAAGHVAIQHAIRLSMGFEHLASELREYASGTRGHVRLWAGMSALTQFLPRSLQTFLVLHPNVRIEVEEQVSPDIVRALIEGVADIGIFGERTPAHGLQTYPYRTDQLVVICQNSHPLARRRKVDFRSCLHHEFVGLNRGSALHELMSKAAADEGVPLRLRMQVRSFDAMRQMIGAGLGIGILPLGVPPRLSGSTGLKIIPLTEEWASRKMLVGVSASARMTPAVASFLEHLKEEAGEAGPS